jgi:hypothetical protein
MGTVVSGVVVTDEPPRPSGPVGRGSGSGPRADVPADELELVVAQRATRGGQQPVLDGLDALVQAGLVVVGTHRHRLLRDDRAVVDLSSTRWTVQPVSFTPWASASRTAWAPRKAGSNDGWVLTTRSGQRARKSPDNSRMKPASTTTCGWCAARSARSAASQVGRSGWAASGCTTVAIPAAAPGRALPRRAGRSRRPPPRHRTRGRPRWRRAAPAGSCRCRRRGRPAGPGGSAASSARTASGRAGDGGADGGGDGWRAADRRRVEGGRPTAGGRRHTATEPNGSARRPVCAARPRARAPPQAGARAT